eukprot:2095976-Rhodomonas_salina.1
MAGALAVELAEAIADVAAGGVVGFELLRLEAVGASIAHVHARGDRADGLAENLHDTTQDKSDNAGARGLGNITKTTVVHTSSRPHVSPTSCSEPSEPSEDKSGGCLANKRLSVVRFVPTPAEPPSPHDPAPSSSRETPHSQSRSTPNCTHWQRDAKYNS